MNAAAGMSEVKTQEYSPILLADERYIQGATRNGGRQRTEQEATEIIAMISLLFTPDPTSHPAI
jgi:hypothetical protein